MTRILCPLLGSLMMQVLSIIPASSQVVAAQAGTGSITIITQPVFNGLPLKLNDQYYIDEHGDTLNIETFKFYLTHVELDVDISSVHFTNTVYTAGLEIKKSFLFNAEDSTVRSFTVDNLAGGHFNGVSFTLGVDSIDNTSGANEGALDPVNGMYWAWNSGYIMAKLEGHSKVCKTLHHAFEFHIGGYMPPYNTAREVHLKLPQNIEVKKGDNKVIIITADVAAWFKGEPGLSKLNDVVIPGKEASLIADRYAQMFSIGQK